MSCKHTPTTPCTRPKLWKNLLNICPLPLTVLIVDKHVSMNSRKMPKYPFRMPFNANRNHTCLWIVEQSYLNIPVQRMVMLSISGPCPYGRIRRPIRRPSGGRPSEVLRSLHSRGLDEPLRGDIPLRVRGQQQVGDGNRSTF